MKGGIISQTVPINYNVLFQFTVLGIPVVITHCGSVGVFQFGTDLTSLSNVTLDLTLAFGDNKKIK